MSSQPVGYRVVLICLFIGRGSEAVKVGGSVIYGIPFDSWGKISTGTLSAVSCSISDVYLFYYIFLYLTYFIFLCTY